jgi:hypothetical protein
MVSFSPHLLNKYGGAAKFGNDLIKAGTSLQAFMSAIRQGHVMPSADQMDEIRSSYDAHLRSCKAAGISFSPKYHLACHLVARIGPGPPQLSTANATKSEINNGICPEMGH